MSAPARPLVRRTLADVRPGDRIHAFVAHTGEIVALAPPWLVIRRLHVVDPVSGVEGVSALGLTRTPMNLYADTYPAVLTVRERGFANRATATAQATKAAGYVTKGGCYHKLLPPLPGYTAVRWHYLGIRGHEAAATRYLRDGWITQLDGRWYVTALPALARTA